MLKAFTYPLLLTLLACCSIQQASGLSFWDSQFSTSEFSQFQYKGQFMVTIFQHLTKNTTFYITPLVLLDHKSGVVRYNELTEFWELRFDVIMWDTELMASVANHLTTVRGVRRPDVKLLPMEKVRFEWRSRSRPLKRNIVMENEFIATHHLPRLLTLTFACRNQTQCEQLKTKVRADPESLDSLVLDCFMTAQKSATKTVTVTTENVLKSSTFSKLMQLPADGNYRYMRSEDFNNLVQETYSSVRATTIRSSEYVEKYDEMNIMKLIEDALKQDEVFTTALSSTMWNSVFWDPVFARPDKVVKEASKTFKKDESSGHLKVNRDYLRSSEEATKLFSSDKKEGGFSFWGFSINGGSTTESTSETRKRSELKDSYSSDELNKRLQESDLNVEWNGERFVVKPFGLMRVNQQTFRSNRQLVSNDMQLTIYQQTISLKVIVTPEHNESSALKEAARPSEFPTQYSYCVLSNGGTCPPGFSRSSAFMKAIHLDTSSEGMIRNAKLGDSAIRCHSPADSDNCAFKGWEPYKGELHLHVCCR